LKILKKKAPDSFPLLGPQGNGWARSKNDSI